MNCAEVRRMLDAYLDGELDLTRQLDVETHLPGCATRKDAAEDITKFCSLVHQSLTWCTSSDECASLQRASRA
jgi:anti-sigma factor RsiW